MNVMLRMECYCHKPLEIQLLLNEPESRPPVSSEYTLHPL